MSSPRIPRSPDRIPRYRSTRERTQARARPNAQNSQSRQITGIIGGILLGIAVLWIIWRLFHPTAGEVSLPILPIPGLAPTYPAVQQVPPLAAAGVTLGTPAQASTLNQQQALLLARQLEPDAAANAQKTIAEYVLLSYNSTSPSSPHHSLSKIPAWMVVYQRIPLAPADASVDPTPFPQSYHDLYVFLDAGSGKELLTIWV